MVGKLYLVDGARGHTGTFLVKEILETEPDCKIVATDLWIKERRELMKKETVFTKELEYMTEILKDERVEFIAADLTKPESLKPLFKDKNYDVIFHPASLYDYFAELDILRKINVEGTRNLLEIICETQDLNKVRFIHWSTCGVYGQPKKLKYDKELKHIIPADETSPYNPPNNYSISKMEQEDVVYEFYEKKKLKMTITRPAPIYGPYQLYGMYHIFMLVYIMGHAMLPAIYPGKKHKLAFPSIHVEDLVKAAIFLSKKDEAIGEAYNIIHDLTWQSSALETVYEELALTWTYVPMFWPLYKLVAKLAFWMVKRKQEKAKKLGVRPLIDAPMAGYITHQYAFSNKKLLDLGYKFKYQTVSGFKQTIRWYKDHGWFPTEDEDSLEVV